MTNALSVFKLGLGLLDFFPSLFVSVQSCRSTTAVIVKSCTSCITGCCTISDICNYEIIHCHLYKNTSVLTYLCHLINPTPPPPIFFGALIKAQICFCNLDFSDPVTATITTKGEKNTVIHWFFAKSLNIKQQCDWPLTLHPSPLCESVTHSTSWCDWTGERKAASTMAYYQPSFCLFMSSIVKE